MFKLENYDEIIVLHKTIMELKFWAENPDSALIESPFLASVSFRLVEALSQLENERDVGQRKKYWMEWSNLTDDRYEWEKIRDYLVARVGFLDLPVVSKKEILQTLAAPLRFSSESKIEQMLKEIREMNSKSGSR